MTPPTLLADLINYIIYYILVVLLGTCEANISPVSHGNLRVKFSFSAKYHVGEAMSQICEALITCIRRNQNQSTLLYGNHKGASKPYTETGFSAATHVSLHIFIRYSQSICGQWTPVVILFFFNHTSL